MQKLLIISGPTAIGKTSLGFALAKKYHGEIISADSRQVYREMDIVTGKEVDNDIKTWMIDVVNPDEEFSVSHYYNLAWQVIEDIWKREKLPIVVGGTGLYIKALIDGIGTMGIAPNLVLRSQLEQLQLEQLQKRLEDINPKRWEDMNKSDRSNPRRLVRAIEVAQKDSDQAFRPSLFTLTNHRFTARVHNKRNEQAESRMTSFWGDANASTSGSSLLWIGLKEDFATLHERIDQRVDERIKFGAVEETKNLAIKYGWDIPSMTGLGYRELRGFIRGEILLEEAVKNWKFAEHKYTRRQLTWFKKEKRIKWFDNMQNDLLKNVFEDISLWVG